MLFSNLILFYMEERLHHFELHSEYFIVDIRYLSKVLFRFPIVVTIQEDKSSILFFKSKEFHMFILMVELNLAKCRLPKGPKFVFKF